LGTHPTIDDTKCRKSVELLSAGNLPHLHFEVFRTKAYDYSDAIPVSFLNGTGARDAMGGLIAGEKYEAEPF
jgi:hypothetical protein